MQINNNKIKELLSRGIEEVIDKKNLEKQLFSGKKLRIKFGIDPTGSDLHLGHSIPLFKLREFQELGHNIIFLIGNFTAQIGDPAGRAISRVSLSLNEVRENMKNYQKQASKILDMDKVEVRYNSEWWDKMKLKEFMQLATKITYSQISHRADFKKRIAEDKDFTLEEFMYPVLQGYDSVALKADLEIGGNDQKFNMLVGRRIQKQYKQIPQNVMTLKLLVGLDGKKKMSKSFKNFISINETPKNQYGKIMSIKDDLILNYFELCTEMPLIEIKKIEKNLKVKKINPKDIKIKLAKEIVSFYHGKKVALEAEQEFERVFKEKKMPANIPETRIKKKSLNILDLLVETKLTSSRIGAKRLIIQGGIKINKKIQQNWKEKIKIKKGLIVQKGKRIFVRVI